MKSNYFNEISLFFDIISQHPDALILSSHSWYIHHEQQQHKTALLINLCVIQTHSAVCNLNNSSHLFYMFRHILQFCSSASSPSFQHV